MKSQTQITKIKVSAFKDKTPNKNDFTSSIITSSTTNSMDFENTRFYTVRVTRLPFSFSFFVQYEQSLAEKDLVSEFLVDLDEHGARLGVRPKSGSKFRLLGTRQLFNSYSNFDVSGEHFVAIARDGPRITVSYRSLLDKFQPQVIGEFLAKEMNGAKLINFNSLDNIPKGFVQGMDDQDAYTTFINNLYKENARHQNPKNPSPYGPLVAEPYPTTTDPNTKARHFNLLNYPETPALYFYLNNQNIKHKYDVIGGAVDHPVL